MSSAYGTLMRLWRYIGASPKPLDPRRWAEGMIGNHALIERVLLRSGARVRYASKIA